MWIDRKEYERLNRNLDSLKRSKDATLASIETLKHEIDKRQEKIKYCEELVKREESFKVLKYEIDKILNESGMSAHLTYLFSESGISLYEFPMTEAFKKVEETERFNNTINTARNIIRNYQSLYDSNHKLHAKINKLEESLKKENVEKLLEIKHKYFTLLKELDIK